MLNRIKIKGYKSLRDIDMRLRPLIVMFGPNDGGKSNFIEVFRFLSRIVTGYTIKDAFYRTYRASPLECFSFPPGGLKELRHRDSVSLSVEVDFALSDSTVDMINNQIGDAKRSSRKNQKIVKERNLRYGIEVEMLPNLAKLQIASEYLIALNSKGDPKSRCKPFLLYERECRLLNVEGLENPVSSERYTGQSVFSQTVYPLQSPHLAAAQQEISMWNFFHFEPCERMRVPDSVKPTCQIGPMGEELPTYLHTLKVENPRGFESFENALGFFLPKVEGIETYLDDRGDIELKLKENGVGISYRALSDGTLRILALLAIGGDRRRRPTLVGLEEPENGIHPGHIQLIAEMFKTRAIFTQWSQYIVATHSPVLVDWVPKKSLFVVTKGDEGTRIEPYLAFGSLGRWFSTDPLPIDIDVDALADVDETDPDALRVSERILRGDFNS